MCSPPTGLVCLSCWPGLAVGFGSRMQSAVVVLLLLCCSVSQGWLEASVPTQDYSGMSVPPGLPLLWDELRGLKDLVLSLKAEEVGRRQVLRSMESQLRDREVEAEQQRRSTDGVQEELRRRLEDLEEQSKGQNFLDQIFCKRASL